MNRQTVPHMPFLCVFNHSVMLTRISLCSLLLSLLCTCDRATNSPAPGVSNDETGHQNHLAGEKSPYLLQHARNPVDWYPWGEEALDKADEENKLLVISVGYAACHWCHVMEHESFEDSTVAAVMNESFISIKVDREERPDIDDVYMSACQLTNERGCGWPLNVIALPDGKPVWTGTYLAKEQWMDVLTQFRKLRGENPAKMEQYAADLTQALQERNHFAGGAGEGEALTDEEVNTMASLLLDDIDFDRGGTQGAPKFPTPALYEFLLTEYFYSGNKRSLEAVTTTLDKMAAGGIYDQLAGGFARYSTDADWKVPHFEKMLYDNGQLISLYARAYQVTGYERYAEVVRQSLEFVESKLSSPEGIFYSSLDADTEGEEGLTYVWQEEEILQSIPEKDLAQAFVEYYSITEGGNWEGKNILLRAENGDEIARKYDFATEADLRKGLKPASDKLLVLREKRPQPGLDDKALTAWNSLMISGYADAFRALGTEEYRQRAVEAAAFLRNHSMGSDGRLYRNYKDGEAGINAFLDDYALFAQACVDLYQITFDESWLKTANQLIEYAELHFYDNVSGLYNYTSDLDPALVTGNVPVNDQAIPSGNSVMARVVYQTGILLADDAKKQRAGTMLANLRGPLIKNGPRFFANWGRLYIDLLQPTYEVAIMGADAGAVRDQMSREFYPNALFLGGDAEGSLELLTNKLIPEQTTIYVCLDKVCQLPVTDAAKALEQLNSPD